MLARVAVSGVTYGIDKGYDYLLPEQMSSLARPGMRVLVPFGRANRRTEAMILSLSEGGGPKKYKSVLRLLDQEPVLDQEGLRLAVFLRSRCFCTLFEAIHVILPAGLWHKLESGWTLADPETAESRCQGEEELKIAALLLNRKAPVSQTELGELLGEPELPGRLKRMEERGILRQVTDVRQRLQEKKQTVCVLTVSKEDALLRAEAKKTGPMQRAVLRQLAQIQRCPLAELCRFTGASRNTVRTLEKAGLVSFTQEPCPTEAAPVSNPPEITLSQQQKAVFERLAEAAGRREASCALLHGVTGSGKTLVYLQLIHRVVSSGRQALVLVPEIGLTPQVTAVFSAHFGQRVAVLHSGRSNGERYEAWQRIRTGNVDVVIGTRSAVFAPLNRLGLIVVDEEQEHTYKSENTPAYHAREVAKFRCVQQGALLLLCSATPSVESRYHAWKGDYLYCRLSGRYNTQALPEVLIADSREDLRHGYGGVIGRTLRRELEKNLAAGEQSILFINRRGTSRALQCVECGHVPECVNCSASLAYHAQSARLLCHHCGFSLPAPERCPECGGELRRVGCGTQKVVEELETLFPGTPVLRMDADTTSAKNAHERILKRFRKEKIPLLVGTQMVTKGLDFPGVTLVGVLNADLSLYVDDYRAAERTFSLITQVVGRAGRGALKGRAVLQTFAPHHPVIQFAAAQDYDGFFEEEIALREASGAPPFSDHFVFTVFGEDETRVLRACVRLSASCRAALEADGAFSGARVLGPAPAPVTRVKNLYRYHFTLCAPASRAIRDLAARLLLTFREDPQNKMTNLYLDQNPEN